jgi:hypothetical protein
MNKNIPISIILLTTILFFTTCKKQLKQTFVEGRLTEYYTGKPIANITLILYGLTDKNIYNNRTDKIVETTTTDAAGHFSFNKFNAYKAQEDNYNISLEGTDLALVVDGKVKDSSPYLTKGKKKQCGVEGD